MICAAPRAGRPIERRADGLTYYHANEAVKLLFEACGRPWAPLWILLRAGDLRQEDMRELYELLGVSTEIVGLVFGDITDH